MPISKATDADKLTTEWRQKPTADREAKPEEARRAQSMRTDEENLRDRDSLFWRGVWMIVF
ncbi:hypothetical protein I6F07_29275 [Ensifer sp. IC4062]|nr:hypothetical protein [Ensifer sp. IC4062]MCA1444214.1 hypothetical protein [Ensifer sp. IC4062]